MKLGIREMQREAFEVSRSKGWHDEGFDATFGDRIALIHSEASEALEAYRARGLETWEAPPVVEGGPPKPEGVVYELADVVIRIGDLCEKYGLDLESAIRAKTIYNQTRPHRHGGKRL